MNLNELAKTIRFDNASKGFDPTEGGIEHYLLLTISEICEAQNELRDRHSVTEIYYELPNTLGLRLEAFPPNSENQSNRKPCGFPVEIADAIIRILDIQAKLELEITVFRGTYDFDPTVSLDKELLSICRVIAQSGERDIQFKLNLALTGLLQITHNLNIPIMEVIQQKLEFNRSRPPKHGRKF